MILVAVSGLNQERQNVTVQDMQLETFRTELVSVHSAFMLYIFSE